MRWVRAALIAVAALVVLVAAGTPASAATVSKDQAIVELQRTRASVDETLRLLKDGDAEAAYAQAKAGYLTHFEQVEIPLRVADPQLTADAEGQFAEIRNLIDEGAPVSDVREKIVALRVTLLDAERALTSTGLTAPALVFGQSFLIIFREGLEVVLLLSVLLGYLEAAKANHLKRPVLIGVGAAVLATAATLAALRLLFDVLPVGTEVLEAITALVAVAMLFWVSFWLISRLEHKRWMEFLKARVWTAVSIGSATGLMLIGFTAVYREGFETALFYQALLSFGTGLAVWVLAGFLAGLVVLAGVSVAIFRLGRRLPVRTFMTIAVAMVMVTSVFFLGNAVHALQTADLVPYTVLDGWPRPPIFVSQATGYWPTLETVVAQAVLAAVYVIGALYVFGVKPRLDASRSRVASPESQQPQQPVPVA